MITINSIRQFISKVKVSGLRFGNKILYMLLVLLSLQICGAAGIRNKKVTQICKFMRQGGEKKK
jgi:hypothetical protein